MIDLMIGRSIRKKKKPCCLYYRRQFWYWSLENGKITDSHYFLLALALLSFVLSFFFFFFTFSNEKLTTGCNKSVLGHFRGRFANYEDKIFSVHRIYDLSENFPRNSFELPLKIRRDCKIKIASQLLVRGTHWCSKVCCVIFI